MQMEKNYYIENRTIYTIAAAILCLQGVCGISLVRTGASSLGYVIDYYDYMFSSISIVLMGINIICGIVILGAYMFAGVSSLCRKKELIRFGIAACGVSYVLVVIRDIVGAAYYGISGTLFLNILCLAVFALLVVALLTETVELRQIIVKYNTILWAVPAAIFILTLIVSRYFLGAGNVFFSIVEMMAQIAAIYITAAVIQWDASGNVPAADAWNRGNAGVNATEMNNTEMSGNMNYSSNSNTGNTSDTNSAFNTNKSVQTPEGYRSVALVIVFSIITLGIYALYWVFKVSQMISRELRTGKSETVQLLLFMFVPFYSWYWYYKMTENIGQLAAVKGRNRVSSIAGVNLLLAIFGFGIVAMALMQDDINKIVGECECYAYQSGYAGFEQQGANGSTYQNPVDAEYEKAPSAEDRVIYDEPAPAAEEPAAEAAKQKNTAAEPSAEDMQPAEQAASKNEKETSGSEPKLPYEELKRLKELLDENIITQEEFEQLKKKFI